MPTDVETRAAPTGTGRATKAVPGLGIGVLVAALSALGFGYAAQASHGAAAAADVARLAEVAPQDIPAALETVEGTPARLAQFKDPKACNARLAWVTVMRAPSQPAGRIRLQSGSYISPGFELTETPVRIALPYPAPYAAGHGTISVLGATADAIVALTPPLARAGAGRRACAAGDVDAGPRLPRRRQLVGPSMRRQSDPAAGHAA